MSTVHKIISNTSYSIIGNIITKIITLFVFIYMARYLGVEDFGKYNFITAYFSVFIVIGVFGLDPVVLKEIARDKSMKDKIMSNVLIIRTLTALAAIFLAINAIKVMNYSEDIVFYVILTSSIMIFQSLSYLYESLFQAYLEMQYYTITLIAYKLVFAVLVFVVIFTNGKLIHIVLVTIFSEFLRTVIDFHYSKKFLAYDRLNLSINLKLWKYLIKEALPFVISAAFFIIYYRIDVLMLSSMKGDSSVGFYSAAYRLTDPFLFLPTALSSTLMAVMSKQYIGEENKLKRTYTTGIRYIFILMIPIAMGISALSEKIVLLLYDTDYLGSAVALRILIWSLLFSSLNTIQSSVLISTDKQKANSLVIGIGCIVNVFLNFMLIPKYDYIGASIATLISVVIVFAVEYYLISKEIPLPRKELFLKPTIATVIMGLIVIKFLEYNIVCLITIGAFVYFLSMVLLKGFNEEDINLFKRIVNRI